MKPAWMRHKAKPIQPGKHQRQTRYRKNKLVLLGGGLLVAVLFFAFTSLVNHSSSTKNATGKKANNQAQEQASSQSKGSITPLMETVRNDVQENTSGRFIQATLAHEYSGTGRRGKRGSGVASKAPRWGASASNTLAAYLRFPTRSRSGGATTVWRRQSRFFRSDAAIPKCSEGSIAGICARPGPVAGFKHRKSRYLGCSAGAGDDARVAD